jgi:hypothetical protein
MDLMELKTVQWISIIGALAGVLGLLAGWESGYRPGLMVIIVILSGVFILAEKEKDRASVLFSGIRRFYKSFPEENNNKVFQEVRNEYCYFGVSFGSVINTFRAWHESELKSNVRIRLLLLDPDATEVLQFQARMEKDLFKPVLSPEEQTFINDTVTRVRNGTKLTLDHLATLPSRSSRIEVRLHREKVRFWIHLVDGHLLYIGLLRKGETGLLGPVLLLKPRSGRWSLFDYYREQWETIWETSTPVRLSQVEDGGVESPEILHGRNRQLRRF